MLPANGLKNLTSLQVLKKVDVDSECIIEELGHLTHLRILELRVSLPSYLQGDALRRCGKALVESLGKLTKAESLDIELCIRDRIVNLDGTLEMPLGNLRRLRITGSGLAMFLPTWIKPALLPVLSYLEIHVFIGRGDDIQVLGMMPCLRHLSISVEDDSELKSCVVRPDAFPSAVRCEIGIRNLVPSMFPPGAMPMLQHFGFCVEPKQFLSDGKYTADALCLGHLPSLRSVRVYGVKCNGIPPLDDEVKEIVKSLREKLQHEAANHPNGPLRIDMD
ncbi:unnamed protein product [Urochloa humidicola]